MSLINSIICAALVIAPRGSSRNNNNNNNNNGNLIRALCVIISENNTHNIRVYTIHTYDLLEYCYARRRCISAHVMRLGILNYFYFGCTGPG